MWTSTYFHGWYNWYMDEWKCVFPCLQWWIILVCSRCFWTCYPVSFLTGASFWQMIAARWCATSGSYFPRLFGCNNFRDSHMANESCPQELSTEGALTSLSDAFFENGGRAGEQDEWTFVYHILWELNRGFMVFPDLTHFTLVMLAHCITRCCPRGFWWCFRNR